MQREILMGSLIQQVKTKIDAAKSKECILCSITARIPSSEQIIAGRIRDDEKLPMLDE